MATLFCEVLVHNTETIVKETGMSRNFIGGVIWPVFTNIPTLVTVMAHSTPQGAIQALKYNTVSVHSLLAVYQFLGWKLPYPSSNALQLATVSVTELIAFATSRGQFTEGKGHVEPEGKVPRFLKGGRGTHRSLTL